MVRGAECKGTVSGPISHPKKINLSVCKRYVE
jgi:hypothetical protein